MKTKPAIYEKIMRSSYELLMRKGIAEISIMDIVKRSEISSRTFYRYFKNKEEVINTIVKSGLERNSRLIDQIISTVENPIDAYLILMSNTFEGVKNMSAAFHDDLPKHYPNIYHEMENFINRKVFEFHVVMINRGISMGLYRKEINVDICARFLIDARINSLYRLFSENKKFSKDEIYFEINAFIIYGLCTTNGLERFKYAADRYFPQILKHNQT